MFGCPRKKVAHGVQEEEDLQLLVNSNIRRKRRHLSKLSIVCLAVVLFLVLVVVIGAVLLSVYGLARPPSKKAHQTSLNCSSDCKLSIVETIPENLTYSKDQASHISTYLAWMQLLQAARTNVTISSFYWTLRGTGSNSDVTDNLGSNIFNALKETASRGVKIQVVQGPPSSTFPNNDTKVLADDGAIELRSLDLTKLFGAGIIHTKMWIIDNQHFYVGSANMDWRSLAQVKELGILGMNCSCLASDAQKMFEVYWELADRTTVPSSWPDTLTASFNMENPARLKVNGTPAEVFFGSSPPKLKTKNRTDDITGLLNVIESAKQFIYIAVMDYVPAMIYSMPHKYWSCIDDALRSAAYNRGVNVRILGSNWSHTPSDMFLFLKSLSTLQGFGPFNGTIETKMFVVPPVKNKTIPFTRVNHNKYMVTDNAAYIGTSNWSGDYFVDTGGVSCVVNQTTNANSSNTIQEQLKRVFERDWNSPYTTDA